MIMIIIAGAEVLETTEEVYHKATMIVKVKEPHLSMVC